MKLYELANASIEDQLRKTAQSIPNKTQSPPGMNPQGGSEMPTPTGATPEGGESEIDPTTGEPMTGAGGAGGQDPGMGGAGGGQMGAGGGDPMGDAGGMGGGMGGPPPPGNAPDAPMQEPVDDEAAEQAKKKVDGALIAQVQNLPFVSDFDHSKTKMGPYEILQMDKSDLAELRTILTNKINKVGFTDQFGKYDDPTLKYHMAMLNYVERVIQVKNELAKNSNPSGNASEPKPAKAKDMDKSKVKPGEVKQKPSVEQKA